MRIPTQLTRHPVGFNMTPMIDIVFLLIIFFLVSSHLASREARMELDLPSASSGDEAINEDRPRITMNLDAEGRMFVAGRRIASLGLREYFQTVKASRPAGIEVRIRADRKAKYSSVEPVLKAVSDVGIWNVTFAVVEER